MPNNLTIPRETRIQYGEQNQLSQSIMRSPSPHLIPMHAARATFFPIEDRKILIASTTTNWYRPQTERERDGNAIKVWQQSTYRILKPKILLLRSCWEDRSGMGLKEDSESEAGGTSENRALKNEKGARSLALESLVTMRLPNICSNAAIFCLPCGNLGGAVASSDIAFCL